MMFMNSLSPVRGLACLLALSLIAMQPALAAKGGRGKGGGNSDGNACKVTATTDIAIYVGGGIGPSSKLWAEALIDFWKTGSRRPGQPEADEGLNGSAWSGEAEIDYVTLTLSEFNACTAADFTGLLLFVMPGGSAYEIQDNLGASGKSKLTAFLDGGGNYLGMCAGGYYAARGYYWKGDDGAPTDNCKNQFCRYETAGTFSFDSGSSDFTVHEWNGTSYHSNLLAYGPLANVYVEGPIEEIAGPWHIDSNPDHPYDSHLITTDDNRALRVIYWGGATENYIYAHGNGDWGTEHAHFAVDTGSNNDLEFPKPADAQQPGLWALKSVGTNSGGSMMISSAHIEASLFHTATTFTDGGMTECQQYNNYTYLLNKVNVALGYPFRTPEYDSACGNERGSNGEEAAMSTASLFPAGLAYQNAPRIGEPDNGGGDGGNGDTGFDNGTLGDFEALPSTAARPWVADSAAACTGSHAARAGHSGGVDSESEIRIMVPPGATTASYQYSYPSALDRGDDFHVIVNSNANNTPESRTVKQYETGPGETCASDTVDVSGAESLQFRCRSGGKHETCTVDEIIFN
jgi:hypothetical protein